MPAITFDKKHVADGFVWIAFRGEVGCLPDDVFVISDELLGKLKRSGIPFTRLSPVQQIANGDSGVKSKARAKKPKVPVRTTASAKIQRWKAG